MVDSVSGSSNQAADSQSFGFDSAADNAINTQDSTMTAAEMLAAEKTTEEKLAETPTELDKVAKDTAVPTGDWTENWFSAGEHQYEHLSPAVCEKVKPDCSQSAVVDALNKTGVHPNQQKGFVPGETYIADVNLPGPFGKDHISTTAIYNDQKVQIGIKNTTLPNHLLHPGSVERTVVLKDGSYHISTQGVGTGILGGPNVWFDESVWSPVDQNVINQFNK